MRPEFLKHASQDLPRYTSYPTAVRFGPGVGAAEAQAWAAEASGPISVYVHTPFCEQLCWYCGCHMSVPNGYARVAAFVDRLQREIDLWAGRLGRDAYATHLHFGGGSPNALSPRDFLRLADRLRPAFSLADDAEFAVELDPRTLRPDFIEAMGVAGVTRASLGVQSFDPTVQAKVNRIQPFAMVADAVRRLRDVGVGGLNFDLMYGLPAQDPASVADTARRAVTLAPDRIAVFGYAHVPWFKKHQQMIRVEELAEVEGRWDQAEAIDAVLVEAGYVRIGLDHYARADDPMAAAEAQGRLRRNFQGYTTDAADTLIPLGPSAIGEFRQGFVQNAKASDVWGRAIESGALPVERGLRVQPEDRLRGAVIERLMCDLQVDVGALCRQAGFAETWLDPEIAAAADLSLDGLCEVNGRRIRIPGDARRLMRVTAAVFDQHRAGASGARHAKAV